MTLLNIDRWWSSTLTALLLFFMMSPSDERTSKYSAQISTSTFTDDTPPTENGYSYNICTTRGCVKCAASVLANMDDSVRPCDDFYQFACGKFIRDAQIDDDKTSRTTYNAVNDMLVKKVRWLLEKPRPSAAAAGGLRNFEPRHPALVKRLYDMCMDERRMNERGVLPLLNLISRVGGWPLLYGDMWNDAEFRWTDGVYRFRELGLSVDYFVDLSVKVNHNDTSEHIIELDHAALALNPVYLKRGLGDKMVNSYFRYMVDVAVALGAKRARAKFELRQSLEFEVRLAKISQVQSIEYLTVYELVTRYPGVPWYEYINRLLCPGGRICVLYHQRVIVNMPSYLSGLVIALTSTDRRVHANYMVWRAVASCVPFANRGLRDRQQILYEELFGRPAREPRWTECVDIVSSSLYLAIGRLYVKQYFDENIKNATVEMVERIRKEMHDVLLNSVWMDPVTKNNALDKAEAMDEFVAYPNELLDAHKVDDYYSPLRLDDDGHYFESMLHLAKFECDKNFERLHAPVNKSDWVTHGRAVVFNAFYNLVENSIQFPAGILQGMFFSGDRPNYMNYGGIGYVIGHEITHGFDDQGCMYDKMGNMRNWWRPETSEKFKERARCVVRQYNSFEVAGKHVNGLHTLDENIADNGGVMLAYRAYRRWSTAQGGPEPRLPGLDRYTPEQMFWISAANVWCSVYRPEILQQFLLTDQHSPGRYRVIGSFQNQLDFAADFQCPAGSFMNPMKKCKVW